jgi:predicted GIY-YIG superfamily endonuclease
MLPLDSTLLCWRGQTVLLTPPHHYFVYLLHFHCRYYHAGHYTGMTACLDARLALHRSGHGARLMKAVVSAGITFEVARLWQVATYEEARELERALKRRHDGPALCPVCQQKPFDALTQMRRGHSAILTRPIGKRRSMCAPVPCFVRRPREREVIR